MLSSHQISAMHQQQMSAFAGAQGYSQMIGAAASNPYAGGYNSGPVPPPPAPMMQGPMVPQMGGLGTMGMMSVMAPPQAGFQQGFGEQLAATTMGGLAGVAGFANNTFGMASGVASLGAMGMGLLGAPVGGAIGAMAGLPGTMIAGGLAAGAFATNEMFQGVQQRQQVGQVLRNRFGGVQGIGSGAGGTGFSSNEMGQISTMVREMSAGDEFTSTEELTRVLDSTAQQRLYRGVQGIKEFKTRFRDLVSTLKSMAEDMQTTVEGASELMGQQRSMGIFGSEAIESSLTRTRLQAGASGISFGQMQQIGMQGAQMGRAMGMRGSTGARMLQNMAAQAGVGMQMGVLSDEMISEATGGLTGAEGAQAYAGIMAQASGRFMRRGAGSVLTAALWDSETGGINQDMMERLRSGELDFNDLRREGRRNIAATGGNRSEFFRDRERIVGEVIAGGGSNGMIAALGTHLARQRGTTMDDPRFQRFLGRRLNITQAQVEAVVQETQNLGEITNESRTRVRQQLENTARTQSRNRQGVQGMRRRIAQIWERDVEAPFNQIGDDIVSAFTEGVEGMVNELTGTVSSRIAPAAIAAVQEEARGGRAFMMSRGELSSFRTSIGSTGSGGGGLTAGLGRMMGLRQGTPEEILSGMGIDASGSSPGAARNVLNSVRRDLNVSRGQAAEILGGDEQFNSMRAGFRSMVLSDMSNATRADQSIWEQITGAQPASTRDEWITRVNDFRATNEDFRNRTSGLSIDRQIGLAQRLQDGNIRGGFALDRLNLGDESANDIFAAGRTAADVRRNAVRALAIGATGGRQPGAHIAANVGIGRGGSGVGGGQARMDAARGAGLNTSGIGSLLGAVEEDSALFNTIRDAAAGNTRAMENLVELSALEDGEEGAGVLSGTVLNQEQRGALGQLVTGEGAQGRMEIIENAIRATNTININARYSELAGQTGTAMDRASSTLRRELGGNYDELRSIVSRRASGEGAMGDEETAFFTRLAANPDDVSNLANAMSDLGPSGQILAAQARNISRRVRDSRNSEGSSAARIRGSLTEQLQAAGVDAQEMRTLRRRGVLGNRTVRGIESGDMTAAQLREQIEGAGVDFDVTRGQLEQAMSGTFEFARGGMTAAERREQIVSQEVGASQGRRLQGAPDERRETDEGADAQAERMQRLVDIAESREQSEASRHTSLMGALNSIATNTAGGGGGGNDDPGGNGTTNGATPRPAGPAAPV